MEVTHSHLAFHNLPSCHGMKSSTIFCFIVSPNLGCYTHLFTEKNASGRSAERYQQVMKSFQEMLNSEMAMHNGINNGGKIL